MQLEYISALSNSPCRDLFFPSLAGGSPLQVFGTLVLQRLMSFVLVTLLLGGAKTHVVMVLLFDTLVLVMVGLTDYAGILGVVAVIAVMLSGDVDSKILVTMCPLRSNEMKKKFSDIRGELIRPVCRGRGFRGFGGPPARPGIPFRIVL